MTTINKSKQGFYEWFTENEQQLEELYDQEYCLIMKLNFHDFVHAIYGDNTIINFY